MEQNNPNQKPITSKPWYLSTLVIAFMFTFSIFVIPFIIGVILLIMQHQFERQQNEKFKLILNAEEYANQTIANADNYRNSVTVDSDNYKIRITTEMDILKRESDRNLSYAQSEFDRLTNEANLLKQEISNLTSTALIDTVVIPVDENITSEEYKSKYNLVLLQEKELIKTGNAVITKIISGIEKKVLNNSIKQILRCFNAETTSAISSITTKNIGTVKNKISKTYEVLNKIFETHYVSISKELLELKFKQADLMYSYEYQKEQERLQQKAIKEQMIEEEKVRREIEKEKSKIEKEERQFKNEINKLMEYLRKSSDIEKQLYVDKIKELEEKLALVEKDKENVLNREQNTRAGYVYIISNIGSFGDDVYKIGMTRRLEPMDRINELSSASVPFEFDVHAMIFSEDAPTLENTLHKYFDSYRVNKVNPRKEFYRVSLSDIEKVVKENFNGTVEFTRVAEAYQYRESLKLLQQ